ncbi:MFS transporter [Streptomyces sp. NPDC049949]|uniref:MFS transporter n=1 Tax=Streptomyces sp. NPDC049949 TaxID=3154627 RepID=UPI0034440EB3
MTGLAVFVCGLDHLVLLAALPAIRAVLDPGQAAMGWLVNAYIVPVAVLPAFMAACGDRIGHRRVFTTALAVFTAGSAVAACSPTTAVLIAARAVQGVGAAAITPLSLTLVAAALLPRRRPTLMGVWGALGGLAVAVGPLAGGAIVECAGWRHVFWINVPLGCVLAVVSPRLLPEFRGERAVARGWKAAVRDGGVLAAARCVSRTAWAGARRVAAVLGCAAVSARTVLAVLASGVVSRSPWRRRREGSSAKPHRFESRGWGLGAVHARGFLMHGVVLGTAFWLVQFPQSVQGYGAWEAGLRILPWTAMPLLVAPLSGLVMGRTGVRALLVGASF